MCDKKLQQTYNAIADEFEQKRNKPWEQVDNFLKNNKFIDNKDILMLDLCCGAGRHSFFNIKTISADYSIEMLKIIEKKKKYKKNSPHPVLCDCLNLPFCNDVFDCVICIAGIHHLNSKDKRIRAVLEIKRVLKKGGKFLISVWSKNAFDKKEQKHLFCKWNKKYFRYYYLFNFAELKNLIISCGLKINKIYEKGEKKAKNIWVEGEKKLFPEQKLNKRS